MNEQFVFCPLDKTSSCNKILIKKILIKKDIKRKIKRKQPIPNEITKVVIFIIKAIMIYDYDNDNDYDYDNECYSNNDSNRKNL